MKHRMETLEATFEEAGALIRAVTRNRSLSLNEGTAGLVWKSRKPIWSTDLVRDMSLPPASRELIYAWDGGFRSAFRLQIRETSIRAAIGC